MGFVGGRTWDGLGVAALVVVGRLGGRHGLRHTLVVERAVVTLLPLVRHLCELSVCSWWCCQRRLQAEAVLGAVRGADPWCGFRKQVSSLSRWAPFTKTRRLLDTTTVPERNGGDTRAFRVGIVVRDPMTMHRIYEMSTFRDL